MLWKEVEETMTDASGSLDHPTLAHLWPQPHSQTHHSMPLGSLDFSVSASFCFLPHVVPAQPRRRCCQCPWEQLTTNGKGQWINLLYSLQAEILEDSSIWGSQNNRVPLVHSGGLVHHPYFGLFFLIHSLLSILDPWDQLRNKLSMSFSHTSSINKDTSFLKY